MQWENSDKKCKTLTLTSRCYTDVRQGCKNLTIYTRLKKRIRDALIQNKDSNIQSL